MASSWTNVQMLKLDHPTIKLAKIALNQSGLATFGAQRKVLERVTLVVILEERGKTKK